MENDISCDLRRVSATSKSFNPRIVSLHLKKKEPLEVLMNIYDIGFFSIKKIYFQTGTLTDS